MAFCPGAIFFCRFVHAAGTGKKERVRVYGPQAFLTSLWLRLGIERHVNRYPHMFLPHPGGTTRGHRAGTPSADRPAV